MSHSRSVTISVIANEEEYVVTGNFTPGSPGKYHGDPCSCYEPEPAEAEITEITLNGDSVNIQEFLSMDEVNSEDIEEKLIEAGSDDSPEPDDE